MNISDLQQFIGSLATLLATKQNGLQPDTMNVGDLHQFIGSLATLFAAKQGRPHGDMMALGAALAPFKELPLPTFSAFLELAKEYKDTGKITVPVGKQKKASGSGSTKVPKGPKIPLKTKEDAVAIKEAVDELEKLYSHAADPDLTHTIIETTVKRIHDIFDKDGLKEVAKGFNLSSGIGTKKGCREKIENKIKERKARNERGEVIAAAAKPAPPLEVVPLTAGDVDLVEATVVD